ncbi:hypothetical protein M3573_18785 [Bacillus safensis]|uniref:hypothetical protein n=1 Tax=Bacillus safensis TaxID=561879 RepID=UPI0020413F38|nr:hypothetical protein [Bacillus safensis]MCM3140324.1 hypothetical protein [Bacillus safensis]
MNLRTAIKKTEDNLEKFKETEVYKDSVFSTVTEVECVMLALEIIKLNSYEKGKTYLLGIADTCYSDALCKIIMEFLDDLKKVNVEDNMTFIEFCKEEIARVLNCTEKKITTGEELGLYIAQNVQIPDDKDQLEKLKFEWADYLVQYMCFEYEEGDLSNPFNEQEQFLKDAISQGIKIMIKMNDVANTNWDCNDAGYPDLLEKKQEIINQINTIKSIEFEVTWLIG